MFRKIASTLIFFAMLQCLVGCRSNNSDNGTIIVTPQLDGQRYLVNGQTLEWKAAPGVTDFYVDFTSGSPCKNGENPLHGTSSVPASCVIDGIPLGKGLIQYPYVIKDGGPHKDSTTPCAGCNPNGGSNNSSNNTGFVVRGTITSPQLSVPVQLNCASKVITATPSKVDASSAVNWTQNLSSIDWTITFPKPLCDPSDFDPGQHKAPTLDGIYPVCHFLPGATGSYTYTVTIPNCPATTSSANFEIQIDSPRPQ